MADTVMADHGGRADELRAEELLNRLDDCKLGGGLNEPDVVGGWGASAREPLRSLACRLAHSLLDVSRVVPPAAPLWELMAAVRAVEHASSTEAEAKGGRLDAALARLARALDPSSATVGTDTITRNSASAGASCSARDPAASGRAQQKGDRVGAGGPGRLDVLECLLGYLQAARLIALQASGRQQQQQHDTKGTVVAEPPAAAAAAAASTPADAAAAAAAAADGGSGAYPAAECSRMVRELAWALAVDGGKPSAAQVLEGCSAVAAQLAAQLPGGFFEPLVPPGSLDAHQLALLHQVNDALRDDYATRRLMSSLRARATLDVMLSGSRMQQKGDVAKALRERAEAFMDGTAQPPAAIDLAAVSKYTRGDMYAMGRPSSAAPIIGSAARGCGAGWALTLSRRHRAPPLVAITDRGGRIEEGRSAAMPAWVDASKPTQQPKAASEPGAAAGGGSSTAAAVGGGGGSSAAAAAGGGDGGSVAGRRPNYPGVYRSKRTAPPENGPGPGAGTPQRPRTGGGH